MKYIVAVILVICTLIMGMSSNLQKTTQASTNTDFLRIHIRANSNLSVDQRVKYEIKDEVVKTLIPIIANCKTKDEAIKSVRANFSVVEEVANELLNSKGFDYSAKAKLTSEYFPIRSYNDVVLNSGVYDAVILELGEAKGNNWWCVVYPPLCFVEADYMDGATFKYKSKLVEIINNFFN